MGTLRRATATTAVLLGTLLGTLALGGCGDSETPDETSTDPKVIQVTIEGDSVTPNGDRVEVSTGQEVDLEVTADAPGEIHVHSTPEQELEYDQGTSTVTIQPIDKPGTVDVESHQLEKTIVQLEVR